MSEHSFDLDNMQKTVDELHEENAHLHAQVKELQARGSELENERRMWKARHGAMKGLLDATLEDAVLSRIRGVPLSEFSRQVNWSIKKVEARIELLEKDAWCQVASVARDFVKRVKDDLDTNRLGTLDAGVELMLFLEETRDRFEKALGD